MPYNISIAYYSGTKSQIDLNPVFLSSKRHIFVKKMTNLDHGRILEGPFHQGFLKMVLQGPFRGPNVCPLRSRRVP